MIVRVIVLMIATGWVAWMYSCGPECTAGSEETCSTDVGECTAGMRVCNSAGAWGPCDGVQAMDEVCDGLDNDCDGAFDDIDATGTVSFLYAVPPVTSPQIGPRFLVGGIAGTRLSVDLRDGTAERLGGETPVATGVTGAVQATVSSDGTQAVTARIDGSSVDVALLGLGSASATLGTGTVVSYVSPQVPLAAIPVFEGSRVVLFVLVNNGDNTRSMLALSCDVTSQSVSCPPGGGTTVVSGLSPLADFAVMVPTDPSTPMVLAYYQGPLKVQHVSRTTLQVEGASRSFGGGRGMPSFAAGPGNSAALAYTVSGMLTLHRFEADTLLCSDPDQALDPVETCPDTVSATGVGRPSVARRGAEWLIGHVTANEGWGVAIVDATDGTLLEERTETNMAPASTYLAVNSEDDVLVSQTSLQTGSSVRPLETPTECVCTPQDFFFDGDGDGYGAGTPVNACTPPTGYVANNTDCYDQNANARPGQTGWFATDRGDGSFDYNCDGGESVELRNAITGGCFESNPYAGSWVWYDWTEWRHPYPPCGTTGSRYWVVDNIFNRDCINHTQATQRCR